MAYPLLRKGDNFVQGRVWDAPLFYPAGGLVSSARDIAKLIRDTFSTSSLLSRQSQSLLASKEIPVASRAIAGVGYGLGLEYRQIDASNTIVWHTGQRPGVSSFVAWHLERQVAVAVLSHIADAPVAGIGYDLMGKVLGRDGFTWPPTGEVCDTFDTSRFDGRYWSVEGFDYQVQSGRGVCKLYSNHLVGLEREQQASQFEFNDKSGGTVGPHTFRFIAQNHFSANGPVHGSPSLALDLRVLSRS